MDLFYSHQMHEIGRALALGLAKSFNGFHTHTQALTIKEKTEKSLSEWLVLWVGPNGLGRPIDHEFGMHQRALQLNQLRLFLIFHPNRLGLLAIFYMCTKIISNVIP
eukprot:TRINITY_DN36815_c0_g1_i1.p1 TRINITY_DN36815_c0_g1~~TRINITY_DN36815_c0_g1_i1.p1  ORF type:complete len:107 (+),score=11.17 TRINITY_DN36815_c0_g1_i1:244-564(+)